METTNREVNMSHHHHHHECHSDVCSAGHGHGHGSFGGDHHHCECCCHHHHDEHKNFAEQLFELADQAWMEVVKEQIKEEIRKKPSDHIHQLAKLIAESNTVRWKEKLSIMKLHRDFEARLSEVFHTAPKKK